MANLLGETTPAVDCSVALVHRQTNARKSMQVNEAIRLAKEAVDGTADVVRFRDWCPLTRAGKTTYSAYGAGI